MATTKRNIIMIDGEQYIHCPVCGRLVLLFDVCECNWENTEETNIDGGPNKMTLAVGVNQSLTYSAYDVAIDVSQRYLNSEIEKALLNGEFVFTENRGQSIFDKKIDAFNRNNYETSISDESQTS